MEKEVNLTLPEWAFLDGNSHLGDMLEGRNVLQHIPSYTIMEFFPLDDDAIEQNLTVKTKQFTYTNIFEVDEKHLLAVHFTLATDFELDWIMHQAIEFYKLFMDWQDNSLLIEETSKDNWLELGFKYKISGIPTKILIDKNGNILSFESSIDDLSTLIDENI